MKPKKKETSYENKGTKKEVASYEYSKGDNSTTYRVLGVGKNATQKIKEKRDGFGEYKKKSKMISTKKAERQMARKDKRY